MSAFDPTQFLYESNITEEQFATTTLEWACLQEICDHHVQGSAALQTAARYISERLQSVPAVHSLKVRVKDPLHLAAKIIRKKLVRAELDFQVTTYEDLITDLIGIRALHLFKHDWREIHDFISGTWEPDEPPLAYIRDGDPPALLDDFRNAGCQVKEHPFGYRSLHYVVRFQPEKKLQRVEIQVRTLIEEAWSEIDHRVRYPLHSSDPLLADFLQLFNRLAGGADEMGTFIKGLNVRLGDHATKVAEIQSQLETREREIQDAVSALKITQEEKVKLKKQIKNMQASSRAAMSVDGMNLSVLTGQPISLNTAKNIFATLGPMSSKPLPTKICSKCGDSYIVLGLMGLPTSGLCSKCSSPNPFGLLKLP